ncbi:heparinase II/III domain-containing protein [Hydrogenimonas sp.]
MKFQKLHNYLYTIKYLKTIQIFYRLFYFTGSKIRKNNFPNNIKNAPSISENIRFNTPAMFENIYAKPDTFTFLNLTHTFKSTIDWNYNKYGKLWTYNLNYFEFLNQKHMTKNAGLSLIHMFIRDITKIKDGLEPFPTSLRGINWIKFLARYKIDDQTINNSLYNQYHHLLNNIEYHLLGNHLLENGFSLLFGAYFFQDERFYRKAKLILKNELDEQILYDGAHFELSPMYHQLMLFRVLDCINLIDNNPWKRDSLGELLKEKASAMLGWLNKMTFENGNIPLFNDSAFKIAPDTKKLNEYAKRLNIRPRHIKLSDSGYRKIKFDRYEMAIDVGNIGPDYIPGHAHSDTFNFELYVDKKPCIVDTGISTYEVDNRRLLERSTVSHNTIEIENYDQSEVWGGFRVANRAYITYLKENSNKIEAIHNGYKKKFGVLHKRIFTFHQKRILITDKIISNRAFHAIARLHFHPDTTIMKEGNHIVSENLTIYIKNADFKIETYLYAPEFNTLIEATVVEIPFKNHLEVEILL